MPHPTVLLRDGCMASRMRYVFLCIYITLADWLLVLAPKSGGKHAFENSVGAWPPQFRRLCMISLATCKLAWQIINFTVKL